ncbi:hypothetical protein VTK26DRAFT_3506 [Humicola hyalothermophila]
MSKRGSILGFLGTRREIGKSQSNDNGSANAAPPPIDHVDIYQANRQNPAIGNPAQFPSQNAGESQINVTAAFENLHLSNLPSDPSVDTCLAHLKLLFAIQNMKEDIGFTDGLWGLWDARAGPNSQMASLLSRPGVDKGHAPAPAIGERMQDKTLAALSKIREKRWALFVAQAVDRYEAWWRALTTGLQARPLCEQDMTMAPSVVYSHFPTDTSATLAWGEQMLPPLDVLMVWHTHMLNPRSFLEDAMRAGMRHFWVTGMPWALVDKAIDNNAFTYNVSDTCKAMWTEMTGLPWDGTTHAMTKVIKCPRCSTSMSIPWTTCGLPEDYHQDPLILEGNGYADNKLQHPCPRCGIIICKELLSVAKFVQDVKGLLGPGSRPMPGTVLDPVTGKPGQPRPGVNQAHTFPNRLLKSGCNSIRSKMTTLISNTAIYEIPTMARVRAEIEAIVQDDSSVRTIDGPGRSSSYELPTESRIAVRKMMSRYWLNFGFFALDLCGAVMRQGVFIEKMARLDWLHSPSARGTMARLLKKYGRFFQLMASNPGKLAVPTLDVDLAWHTHQLSPSRYYAYSLAWMGRFVDHDDKIDENVLSKQFEWTSKTYQERFDEVYSECTCWYCEAIRSAHISTIGKALGMSRNEKIADSFIASANAQHHPPTMSNSARTSFP